MKSSSERLRYIVSTIVCMFCLMLEFGVWALEAGVSKVEITDREWGPVNDPSFAKALVLRDGSNIGVLLTIDAVAIGEIGRIPDSFLDEVRARLAEDPGIPSENVLVNASHCHSIVRKDGLVELVVTAVREATANLAPVKVGAGTGNENRISENRRLELKDGGEVDMRRAYAMPPNDQVASVGPIDPEIGLLRLDRYDGSTLAVVYNFACHPIMNPPDKGNSSDYPGFASQVIEESLGHGALAFFVQGCGGDINPIRYKELTHPRDAEPLGQMLGLSVMRALREIKTTTHSPLKFIQRKLELPYAEDYERRIAAIENQQAELLASLRGTSMSFDAFLPLFLRHRIDPDYPSHYSQSYLHDESQGREDIRRLDHSNRTGIKNYLHNIRVMERLTQLNANLRILRSHQKHLKEAEGPLTVEVGGLRVGDFRLVTFPGELSVQVGLNIKEALGDKQAFVAGYTNGYIYYTPTAEQRNNTWYAQEDCDSLVAPEWQAIFEAAAIDLLRDL